MAPKFTATILLVVGFMVFGPVVYSKEPSEQGKAGGDAALRAYHAGNGLLNRGLYDAAIAEYRSFLKESPGHEKEPSAQYGILVSLFRLDRCDEVLTELRAFHLPNDFPFVAETKMIEAQCLMVGARFADAATVFEDVGKRFEKSELADDAAVGGCEALYRAGEFGPAAQKCATVASQWPKCPLLSRSEYFRALAELSRSEYAAAADILATYEKKYPESEFAGQVPMLLARCHQGGGDSKSAAAQYKAVVRKGDESQLPDALLGLAAALHQSQEYEQAKSALDDLLKRFPDSAAAQSAIMLRAHVLFALGELEQAFAAFESAAKAQTDLRAECAYWMAKCELRSKEYKSAAQRLARAIEAHPDSRLRPEMEYDRAVALIRAEQLKEADAALSRFLEQYPSHRLAAEALQLAASCAHQRGEYDQSSALCAQFVKAYPDSELIASTLFLWAENEFLLNRFEAAVAKYQEFENRFQKDARIDEARLRLATSYYRLEAYDESARYFELIAPKARESELYQPALLALGDIAFQRGEWKIAEQRFAEFLAVRPTGPSSDDALMKLAYARQKQGRSAEAIADYGRLIEQFPKSAHIVQAYFEQGQLQVAAGQFEKAQESFERALSADPRGSFSAPALNQLAALASRRGDNEGAATYYEKAASTSGDGDEKGDALLRQGQALLSAGKFAEAEAALRKSSQPEGRARLIIALARQDKFQDALTEVQRLEINGAIDKLAPSLHASVLYEKAWALRAVDRKSDAMAAYRTLGAIEGASALVHSAWLELAELEFEAGQIEDASADLKKLRETLSRQADAPGDVAAQATYRLAVCEFELGHFAEASDLFEQSLSSDAKLQSKPEMIYFAGEAAFRAGRIDRAVKLLSSMLDEFPDAQTAGPAMLRLGESYAALQKWALSEEMFQRYLERFADAEQWYQAQFGVAWSREQLKRYEEAIAAYEKVIARHQGPTAARAQFQVGQCLYAQKKLEPAVRELLKVDILYAYPEWSAAALFEAGRCFEQLNDPVQARTQFTTVIEKFKETKWAELASRQLAGLASSAALPGK